MDDVMPTEEARARILREIASILQKVVGEDWVHETPIAMHTTFSRDLEVESIELVVLFEKLRERYGEDIDFPELLTSMDTEAVMNLTVGDLVDFIAAREAR